MADKLKKNQRILNSDWDDDTLAYRESLLERSRKEEEEARRLEEARKKANFDNVDSGVTVGMSLDSYGRPQGTSFIEPKPEAPNTDDGYSIWDIGVSARKGGGAVTKGALGLPINLWNLVAGGQEDDFVPTPFKDNQEMAFKPAQQPEFVRGMRDSIDIIQQDLYEKQGSAKSKAKNLEFQATDGLWDSAKFAVTNPGWMGLQAFEQGPQVLASGPGGVTQKVITGALSAAGQAEEGVAKSLREQGFSEQEIADRSSKAFAASLALNMAVPVANKSTFLEGLTRRTIANRVTNGVIREAASITNKEVREGVITEVGDQFVQNLAGNRPWDEGLAQSAVLGAYISGAVTAPTATIQSAAEAGKAASNLQAYLTDQKYNKEAFDLAKKAKPSATREPVQEDMFGGRGEIPITEEGRTASGVGTDTEGVQARLRTQADAVRAQLEADRERLAGFQTRIERAPFAEDQADLLTNQERTDMSRIQERVAGQEKLLAELEAQQTPTQLGLNLQGKNQPKNPKFTGQERSVDQIKSDYFKTQPVQGPQNMTPAQRKAVQKDITEELKRTKAEQKKANDKIKAARAAARRKFLDGQRAGLLDLPVEERAKRLAEAGREWDTANPLVLPTQATQTAAKPAAAPAEAQEAEASVPISTLTEGLQGTPQGTVPLPSTAQAPAQGTTLEDVRKAVGGGKRDKLASRLSYMVEDGNLEIVESQDQIPGDIGEMTVQGKGWYDPNTGKTYLVASNLDSNNTRGDILATLAHETKHAGDFGGSKGLAGSFKPFIGSKANSKMVEKIKKAAKAGDASAASAMRAVAGGDYQSLGLTEDQANSELVANYLTAEHKKKGLKTSLYRGIVSPLRVGAKKLLRSDDVSLEDIHYVADRLVNEVAQRGERMKPSDGNALPMTISGGRTEAEQLSKGRTWLSADGKRKYEISDENSEVRLPEDVKIGVKYPITQVLSHNRLYNELPELKNVTISFEPVEGGGASFDVEDNHITVDSNDELAFNGDVSGGKYKYDGILHRYIIHEMQHASQKVSGSTPGSNPISFLSPEGKKADARIKELEGAIAYGQSIGMDDAELVDMASELESQVEKYNTEAKKATEKYMSGLGEREAHRSMYTIQDSDEALDVDGKGQQEARWDKKPGGLTNSTGKKLKPLVQEQPAKKAAAMPSVSDDQAPPKPRYKYNGKDTVYQWQRDRAIEEEYEASKRAERDARRQRAREDQQVEDASRRSFLKKAAGVAVTAAVAGGARLNNTNITLGRAKPVSEAVLYSNVSPETKTLLENGDLKGALLEMANNGPKELRWLSRTLSQLLPKGTVAVIDPYTNSNAHGETYMGKDGVEIKLFTADGLRGMSHGTILHEVLHAVVMGRYRSLSSGLDHNYKLLGLTKPQALKAMDDFRSLWHEFRDEVNLSGITEEGNSPSLSEAMASPDEFFVRALTDPRLKAIMSKMAYSRGGSIYSRFKNWVKHTLFGSSGQKPSWLDAALMSTEDLLSAMGKDEADFKFINAFDKEIESSKVSNKEVKAKPMPSVAEQSEKDNRSGWNKKKDSSAAIRVVDDLLSTTEGLGTDLFKLLEANRGRKGDLALRAEVIAGRAEKSLRDAATASGISLKQLSTQVEKELEAINKLPDRPAREAAIKALDKTYPGLGTSLSEMRDLKWSLSRAIMEQRAAQGGDLSPKEAAVFDVIIKNAETYTTRAYMANQLKGKKLAEGRLTNIKKNPTGDEATKYNEALQYLMDKYLVIPSKEKLATMDEKDIKRLYEQWVGDSSGVEVEKMAEKLDAIPRKTQEDYRKKAEQVAKELMGATKAKSLTARGFRGARQNRTILEGRENVPPQIRFLMGEITNPVAAEMMTLARLSNLYSQTKMLQEMSDKGENKWYKNHNEGDFNTLLKDDAYGPMKGKWVTPTASKLLEPAVSIGMELEQAISTSGKDLGSIAGMAANAVVEGMRKATSFVKLADLVTSPIAMAWNYVGAYGIAVQNGVYNPADWARAQKLTFNAITSHYKPGKKDLTEQELKEVKEVIRAGVLDSATVGEFQQSFYDNMLRLLEDEQNMDVIKEKIKRNIKDGTMVAKDVYAFMDMWAKVAAYTDRKNYLTKYYEANGENISEEQIIREAGHAITAANISYTRAFKFIKLAERNLPAFTMYMTYFSEVPRSLVASSLLAVSDIRRAGNAKTTKARNLALSAGLRRAAGTLTMTAVLTSMINMFLSGLSDDEERRRKTDPEWEQKGVPVPIGKTKDGKAIVMNILRGDPNGPLTEFMVHMSNLGKNEDIGDALLKTVKNQFVEAKPVMQTFRLMKGLAGMDTDNYEDGYGPLADYLDDKSWGKDENLGRNLMSALEGFTPRVLKGTVRTLMSSVGKRGYDFDPLKEPVVASLQAAGLNPTVRDPEFSLEIATGNYKKAKKEASEDLKDMKAKLGRMNGAALIDELSDVVEDERKAYQALYDVYDGTKAFNGYYTDKDYAKAANGIIKEAKIGPAGNDVANGSFNVRFISKDYINSWRDARIEKIKEMDESKKSKAMAQLRQDYKMVVDYLGTRE